MLLEFECKFCGKPFIHSKKNQKFCSLECRKAYYKNNHKVSPDKPHKPEETQSCEFCGDFFQPFTRRNIYCSTDCRQKAAKARKKKSAYKPKPKLKKVCVVCGEEFFTTRPDKKTCSNKCYSKLHYQEHKVICRICGCCGKKFLATSDSQIFCSEYCRLVMCEDDTPIIKSPAEKSNLDKLIDEADACGLSYGNYKAQLAMGKTFEELKALHERQPQ